MTHFAITTIAALVFLLTALIAATVSAVVLYRLRRDGQWAEAAERHERVDLQYLMKKHVPLDLRTEMPTTELPIAKKNIARLLRVWKPIIAASTALCIVGVILVAVCIRHDLSSSQIEAARRAAAPPKRAALVNPMADIVGTWGTPYDFAKSCSQNPHTMRLLDEGRRIAVTFDKPPSAAIPQSFEWLVVGTQKNEIILSVPNEPRIELKLILDDKDTYHMTRSDRPMAIFEIVARCPHDHASGSW
jgi:hypothetical protein